MDTLEQVHKEVHFCARCSSFLDTAKAPRAWSGLSNKAEVFVVGQALAATTQKESGVPYFSMTGKLSGTGEQLNSFLGKLGYSLFPMKPIKVGSATIPRIDAHSPVYCSEILQCYPGRGTNGHQFPRNAVKNCTDAGYLEREIRIVDPNLILLLGLKTFTSFWKYLIGSLPHRDGLDKGLSATIEKIVQSRIIPQRAVAGRKRAIMPIIHPSMQTISKFKQKILENDSLFNLMRGHLKEGK